MSSFTAEIEFEVFCGTCGAGLCGQSSGGNTPGRGQPYVEVEVCETCLEAARQEIRDDLEDQILALQDQIPTLETD